MRANVSITWGDELPGGGFPWILTPPGRAVPKIGYLDKGKKRWTCLPSMIIVGAGKSGTTMLEHVLSWHPLAHSTDTNGPWPLEGRHPFWIWGKLEGQPSKNLALDRLDHNESRVYALGYADAGQTRYFLENYAAGLPWYANLFPAVQEGRFKFAFEKTAFYYSDASVPSRIQAVLPNVAIVAILREPIHRMWSEFKMEFDMWLNSRPESMSGAAGEKAREAYKRSMIQALQDQIALATAHQNWASDPEEAWIASLRAYDQRNYRFMMGSWQKSRYALHLKPWRELFPDMLLFSTEAFGNLSSYERKQSLHRLDRRMMTPRGCRSQGEDARSFVSPAERAVWVAEMMETDDHANTAAERTARTTSAEAMLGRDPPEWLASPLRATFASSLRWLQENFPETDWKTLWRY